MRHLLSFLVAGLLASVSLHANLIKDTDPGTRAPASKAPRKSIFDTSTKEQTKVTAELKKIDGWFRAGETERAEAALGALIQKYPNEPAPHVALARIQHWRGEFSRACESLKTALQIRESVSLHLDLATVYADGLASPNEALVHAIKATELDASHAGAHYALGRLFARLGSFANAEAAFRRSIQLDANQVASRRGLAQALIQQKKFEEALAQLHEASRDTRDPLLLLELGDLQQVLGQTADAEATYTKAIGLASNSAFLWAKLGMHHQATAQYRKADEAYARALKLDPQSGMVLNNRAALALEGAGDIAAALPWARKAVSLEPKNPHFLDTYGQLALRSGDWSGAEDALRRALAEAPDEAFIKLHLAETLLKKQAGKDEALALLDTLSADPANPAANAARKLRASSETP